VNIKRTVLGQASEMTEQQLRDTGIPVLAAFLDDPSVSEITLRQVGHGFIPVTYCKTDELGKECERLSMACRSLLI